MTQQFLRRGGAVALLAALGCRDATGSASAPPPTLSVWVGTPRYFGMMLGVRMRLPVTLRSARGDTLPLPASFALVSRDPAVVSVDSGSAIRARAMGNTWLVGSAVVDGRPVVDSVEVSVMCTMELRIKLTPPTQTLAVGESFTPAIELSSCGGQLQLSDTVRWAAADSAVVRVDSVSGRTTGLRAGQTMVLPRGAKYGALLGVLVTVVEAAR
jgi:hypothetical protein